MVRPPLAVFLDDRMREHVQEPNHPEAPARLDVPMAISRDGRAAAVVRPPGHHAENALTLMAEVNG